MPGTLVGHARHHVLFVDVARNPLLRSLAHDRTGHVAAGADHHIGLKFRQDRIGLVAASRQIHGGLEVLQQVFAVKAAGIDAADLVARSRHQTVLHAGLRTDKQDLRIRFHAADLIRDSDGRVNVAARTGAA